MNSILVEKKRAAVSEPVLGRLTKLRASNGARSSEKLL